MSNQNNNFDVETFTKARTYSGVECQGKVIDYGITTDGGNATLLQGDGVRVETTPKTSYEHVGHSAKVDEPAKAIYAKNGNIHLEASNGDIIIKAKNIRIVAEDGSGEITITSTKIIDMRAPYIKQNGTNITMTASGNMEMFANTVSSSAQISNNSGTSTDALQGSFLGGILSGLKGLKKFFKECFNIG